MRSLTRYLVSYLRIVARVFSRPHSCELDSLPDDQPIPFLVAPPRDA